MGNHILVRNVVDEPITIIWRRPHELLAEGETVTLERGEVRDIALENRGFHQLLVPGRPWRSIIIAVHENGDYAPERR